MIETVLLVILGCVIQHFWIHNSGKYVPIEKYNQLKIEKRGPVIKNDFPRIQYDDGSEEIK